MKKFKKHFLPLESNGAYLFFIFIMIVALIVSIAVSIVLGSVDIKFGDVIGFLANKISGRRVVITYRRYFSICIYCI